MIKFYFSFVLFISIQFVHADPCKNPKPEGLQGEKISLSDKDKILGKWYVSFEPYELDVEFLKDGTAKYKNKREEKFQIFDWTIENSIIVLKPKPNEKSEWAITKCIWFAKRDNLLVPEWGHGGPYMLVSGKDLSHAKKRKMSGACFLKENNKPSTCSEFNNSDYLSVMIMKHSCVQTFKDKDVKIEMSWIDGKCPKDNVVFSCETPEVLHNMAGDRIYSYTKSPEKLNSLKERCKN